MTRSIEEILAHELLDLIFETFVDLPSGEDWGKPTLFACALACRSWRDLTFRHRFHSLTLYVPPEDMRDREPFSVQAFVALELGARAGKAARNLVLEYGTRAMSTDIAPDLSQFIHDFPLLQSLALSGTILTRFPIISARGLALASIKRLRISACSRGHSVPPMSNEPYALCDLLSQFGAIQELEFEGFMLGAETPPEPAVLQRMALPSIRALVHRAITFQGLAPLLRHMAKTHGIETLDMLGSLPGTGYDVAFATSLDAIPRNIYITVGDTWATTLPAQSRSTHKMPQDRRRAARTDIRAGSDWAVGSRGGRPSQLHSCVGDRAYSWSVAPRQPWCAFRCAADIGGGCGGSLEIRERITGYGSSGFSGYGPRGSLKSDSRSVRYRARLSSPCWGCGDIAVSPPA